MSVVGYLDGYIDENNNEYGLTDTVAQASITAIKDGTTIDSFSDVETVISGIKDGATIDSFGDVETALADKADASDVTAIEGKIPSGASPSNKMATASDVASRVDWESYAKTGVHNFNNTKYETASDRYGVDWTANADGSVKANGTATGGDSANASDSSFGFIAPFTGMVKLLGGADTQFYLLPYDWTDSARPYTDSTKTTRVTTVQYGDTPLSFYMEKGHKYSIIARISTGKTVNNVTIYPLLTVLEDTNTEFTSPAMTNRELTENKVGKDKTSTETKATIFSESSKVASCTAVLNDILCALRVTSTAQASVSGAWTTIATLNEAYRPANLVYETAIDDAGNPFGWARIHPDGKVDVYQGSGSAKTVNLSSLYLKA